MEDWVARALARWPNVPHLYDWLSLDRHGRWHIKDEAISRPQIIDTIARNYAVDERGCWYFQNGPQRGYVRLEYTPLILHLDASGVFSDHCGRRIQSASAGWLDADGGLVLQTEHGPAGLDDRDLLRLPDRLLADGRTVDEQRLLAALEQASGTDTGLQLQVSGDQCIALGRLNRDELPARLGFVHEPQSSEP